MVDDIESGGLSAAEQEYFQSGGEKLPEAQPEPQPSAELAPEQPKAEDRERDDKGKFVPHGALHAEREEHKKTKAELETIRQRQAVLDDRWNTLLKATEKPQEQEELPPNPEEDIFAFSRWQAQQLERLNARVSERDQQEATARQASEQERQLWTAWQDAANAYVQEKPDFNDARDFLSGLRDKQLAGLAKIHPQFAKKEGRDQQINAELAQIIVASRQQNISPAEAVYEMATAWGYTAKEPAPADPGKLELPDQLVKVQSAMEQSRTLGQSNARSNADIMTAEDIANMSEREFEAWSNVPANARHLKTLMGG